MLLSDAEWAQWSNREIARRCHVHSTSVDKYRAEMSLPDSGSENAATKYTTKHGTVATMRTGNIGKAQRASELPRHRRRLGNPAG